MDENIPSAASLEAVHTFPCSFTLKIFGENSQTFPAIVREVGSQFMAKPESASQKSRVSSKGNHLCVSLTFEAQGSDDIRGLYRAFMTTEGVRFLM